MLTTDDHSRDKAGLTYVYPVLSRRAGGLSIGINLNTNNACNWRCIYCQVPDLTRGSAPMVNLEQLGTELRQFLGHVVHGDFYDREQVADEHRVIKDIAISGNGEPTTSSEFYDVTKLITLILSEYGLLNEIKLVLITNGSRVGHTQVQKGLATLASANGEVWFKVDSATPLGIALINNTRGSNISTLKRLKQSAECCPTWIQSCFLKYKKQVPASKEIEAYLHLLKAVKSRAIPIEGVMLYGIARPSQQAEATLLAPLPEDWFEMLSKAIQKIGINVKYSI